MRAAALHVVTVTVTDNATGGDDVIRGQAGRDLLIGGTGADRIDGGTEQDLIFGDNVSLDRSVSFGDHTSPRFRVLSGTQIYSTELLTAGNALVTATWQNSPAGATAWSDYRITFLDHAVDTAADRFGADYIAGGAHDDMIFGQLGDDVIQGDGSIDAGRAARPATRPAILVLDRVRRGGDRRRRLHRGRRGHRRRSSATSAATTSSAAARICSRWRRRPSGPTAPTSSSAAPGTEVEPQQRHTACTAATPTTSSATTATSSASSPSPAPRPPTAPSPTTAPRRGVRLLPRAVQLLDYTPGGPTCVPAALTGDVGGADEIHGEAATTPCTPAPATT